MFAKLYAPKVDNNNALSIKGGTDMSMYDVYAIFVISFSMFIGMMACTLVSTFIVTRKCVFRWIMKRSAKMTVEMQSELEDLLN